MQLEPGTIVERGVRVVKCAKKNGQDMDITSKGYKVQTY